MKRLEFPYSITYSETTPESAEHGDFSDTGFVVERSRASFRELVEMIENEGFDCEMEVNCYGIRASQEFSTSCYRTATERQETLHAYMKEHQSKRLEKVLRSRRLKRERKLRAV